MSSNQFKLPLYAFLGSICWTVHFMLIYLISEFGCISEFGWITIIIAILTLTAIALSVFSAFKSYGFYKAKNKFTEGYNTLAFYGVLSNILFTVIIIFQSIPVIYFAGECY